MAQEEEMSKLFPIFILSILALVAIPWTIYRFFQKVGSRSKSVYGCPCSLCIRSPKNRRSLTSKVISFLSITNITLILMWITMGFLLYYIQLLTVDIQPFEPFSILGLEPGATDSEIKKSYYRLSRLYHPDKNPDPDAAKYFVDYISKAYQALTDEVARKNWEEFGHPDGRQAMNVGIALPKFMLDIQGSQGGLLLLGLVGVGILLPLIVVVIYLSNSSKYTGNNIMHQTLYNYYHLIKPSLAPNKIVDVLIMAAEFLEMAVRRRDEEGLLKIFNLVRGEIISDTKNLKQEQAKFWKRHPAIVKSELLVFSQLCREGDNIPMDLKKDFNKLLNLIPLLLEELIKMSVLPRMNDPYGWLRPTIGVIELSQCIYQAIPLSARKSSSSLNEGIASFLQLPHFDESIVKKISRKKIRTLQDLQDMSASDRFDLLSSVGFSTSDAADVDAVLSVMPSLDLEITCDTEGEKSIQEGDIVTFKVWISIKRTCSSASVNPHSPFYPFKKDELFWIILSEPNLNQVWLSQRVSFNEEETSITATAKLVEEMEEGLGKGEAEVRAAVASAVARVRSGARLVVSKFQAPETGSYNLSAICMSDVWIGCDKKVQVKLKVEKRSRAGTRGKEKGVNESHYSEEEEEDEAVEDEIDEDYESEYSEDEEEEKDTKNNSQNAKSKEEDEDEEEDEEESDDEKEE